MKTVKYFLATSLVLVLSMNSMSPVAMGGSDPKSDAKTLYNNLMPLVNQAFLVAESLLKEVNSADNVSKKAMQEEVNFARGAALEATLLLNMAYNDIKAGKEESALVSLKQIYQQLDHVNSHEKSARSHIKSIPVKSKPASIKSGSNTSIITSEPNTSPTSNPKIRLAPAIK